MIRFGSSSVIPLTPFDLVIVRDRRKRPISNIDDAPFRGIPLDRHPPARIVYACWRVLVRAGHSRKRIGDGSSAKTLASNAITNGERWHGVQGARLREVGTRMATSLRMRRIASGRLISPFDPIHRSSNSRSSG